MVAQANDRNTSRLLTVWVVNAVIFAWLFLDFDPVTEEWRSLLIVPLAAAVAATLNVLVDTRIKDMVVFGPLERSNPWKNAFSKESIDDSRVDEKKLVDSESSTLPVKIERQHTVWYKYYILVEDNPTVVSSRRDYVFTRDYSCTALMFAVVTPWFGFQYSSGLFVPTCYLSFMVGQYLVVRWLAARHGRDNVVVVLAVASAKAAKADRIGGVSQVYFEQVKPPVVESSISN